MKKPQTSSQKVDLKRTPTKDRDSQQSYNNTSNTNNSHNHSPFDRSQYGGSSLDREIYNLFRESNGKTTVSEHPMNIKNNGRPISQSYTNQNKHGANVSSSHQHSSSASKGKPGSTGDPNFNYAQFFRSYNQIKDFVGELKRNSFHEGSGGANLDLLSGQQKLSKGRDAEGYEIFEGRKVDIGPVFYPSNSSSNKSGIKCETERFDPSHSFTSSSKRESQANFQPNLGDDRVESKRIELSEAINSLKKSIELLKTNRVNPPETGARKYENLGKDKKSSRVNKDANFSLTSNSSRYNERKSPNCEKNHNSKHLVDGKGVKVKLSLAENSLRLDDMKINSFLQEMKGKNHKGMDPIGKAAF